VPQALSWQSLADGLGLLDYLIECNLYGFYPRAV